MLKYDFAKKVMFRTLFELVGFQQAKRLLNDSQGNFERCYKDCFTSTDKISLRPLFQKGIETYLKDGLSVLEFDLKTKAIEFHKTCVPERQQFYGQV